MSLLEFSDKFSKRNLIDVSVSPCDLLLIHESYMYEQGTKNIIPYTPAVLETLFSCMKGAGIPYDEFAMAPAVNIMHTNDFELEKEDVEFFRENLWKIIDSCNPKVIVTFGVTPLKILSGFRAVGNRQGVPFIMEDPNKGTKIKVLPTFNPISVYSEPVYRKQFIEDLFNAYNWLLKDDIPKRKKDYKTLMSIGEIIEYLTWLKSYSGSVSVDLETTGLDFKKDKIQTIGFSTDDDEGVVIPIRHKESTLTNGQISATLDLIAQFFKSILSKKYLQNCKFDLKFMMNEGITEFKNIYDTQVMHSLIDENRRHALSIITRQYLPEEVL